MRIADCSFIRFVYPFTFRPETFSERVAAIDANKKVWTQDKFPVGETLFHVADYLATKPGNVQAARLWKLSEHEHNPLRLTDDLECHLLVKNTADIPCRFGSYGNGSAVELSLFSVGVGFLTVSVHPTSPDVDHWLAFLHHFRTMGSSSRVSLRIIPRGEARHPFEFATDDPKSSYGVIQERLLNTAALAEDTKQPWWYDVFVPDRMIPFAALYVDGMPEGPERGKLLYQVRNFFHAGQTVIAPPEDLQVKDNPALLPYADGQQFVFSLEGGSFVAFDAPADKPFFRETLPSHLRDQYFLVFLLTLHQRFALMRLSQRVAERWGDEEGKAANFERIREAFLDFSARGYFVQVMQREHHHRFYRKWHHVYQLDQLYQEVRDEVREMHEYLRTKQAERAQRQQKDADDLQEARTNLVTYIVAALTLTCAVFGFLGINVEGLNVPSLTQRFAEILVSAVVVASALLVLPAIFHVNKVKQAVGRERKASHTAGADPPPLPPRPAVLAAPRRAALGPEAAPMEDISAAPQRLDRGS